MGDQTHYKKLHSEYEEMIRKFRICTPMSKAKFFMTARYTPVTFCKLTIIQIYN